ncbi:aminotransferase [Nocardioides sp. BP30]|uniref:aminotransferase n=1 Tax=Nocardioides sp. BP30 TaxID=3036374 RepID=UPI002468A11B|nr:aminotransferase [Nocardioides sp. BP30]WGL51666.1 aminotransferase [Nocardioides sp. BP30]
MAAEPFELGGLSRPRVSPERAAEVAARYGAVTAPLVELGSQQDRNFLVTTERGRFVLKLANAATGTAELEAQHLALRQLAAAGLGVPLPVADGDGAELSATDVEGERLLTRLLTFVEGEPLIEVEDFGLEQAALLGDTAGRVVAALVDFDHPGLHRRNQWDLRLAGDVVAALLDHVPDEDRRTRLAAAREEALRRLAPVAGRLREQTIHADITDDNVVRDAAGRVGVIDFGDLQRSWRVAELAATCAATLTRDPDPALLLGAVEAFTAHVPLDDAELTALWPLVWLRTAVLVVSGEQQVALDGDNEYADVRRAAEWRSFALASSWDPDEMDALVRAAAGRLGQHQHPFGPMLPAGLAPAVLDLSVLSPALDGGAWLEEDIEDRLLEHGADGGGVAVTRWAEYRLTRARPLTARNGSPTLALAVDLVLPPETVLRAPFAGGIEPTDDGLVLRGEGIDLFLHGRLEHAPAGSAKGAAAQGAELARVTGRLRVQLSALLGVRPPAFVAPRCERLWRRISPDPSALLGVDVAAEPVDADSVLARRDAAYAQVQEHYYRRPPQIERGWRELLVDTTAQVYVDAVNNVATLGHSHPRLVEAAARQWALLNTNARFHYAVVAELSERLAELAPDGLDHVFLVNSGSEAVDLALRLAQTATARPRILAAREAYHGWTIGSDAVSTSLGDNPRALESRPAWVELMDAPNPVRGTHRGPDSAAAYLADLDAQLDALGAAGRQELAGVILEPIFGNGGGVLLPQGYVAGVYDRVRALGGLCISDEVQVGYGRLGDHFWGFEQQGAVPDIITIAKAMGNGQPLGAVLTTRAIAEAFAAEGSFFSSAGGSPVSARIGLTVLDVVRDEGLQDNARVVGGHFRERLLALAERHPSMGAVHGMGLYLGVELVSDRAAFTPDGALADRVCEELLWRGCIVQPTGDFKNVLKIKPPLVITQRSVDFVCDALDEVLTELGG